MSPENSKSYLYRLFFTGVLALLGGTATLNFINHVRLATDESVLADLPSNLYISKSFPALDYLEDDGATPAPQTADSILAGDLLIPFAMNRGKGALTLDVMLDPLLSPDSLFKNSPDSNFQLLVFRPSENAYLPFEVAGKAVPDSFFTSLKAVYVQDLEPDGASDRAGVRKGDLIVRINQQKFKDKTQAENILANARAGRSIDYQIIRQNKNLTLQVVPARLGIRLPFLTLFLSGLFFMSTGGFIAINRSGLQAARLVGLALMMIGYVVATLTSAPEDLSSGFAVGRNTLLVLCIGFGMAVLGHSRFYFPVERPQLSKGAWKSIGLYLIPLASFGLILRWSVYFEQSLLWKLGLALLLIIALTIIYSFILETVYRKSRTQQYKRLRKMIFSANILAAAGTIVIHILSSPEGRVENIGFVGLPLALIPLAYLYTIGRYRLLTMDLRVRRNLQFTILTAIWNLTLITVFAFILIVALPKIRFALPNIYITGATIEFLDEPLSPETNDLYLRILIMLAATLTAWLLWKVSKAGQKIINRFFHRDAYDFQRATNALAEVMGSTLTMVDLAKGVVEKLSLALKLKRAGVLFYREERVCCCSEAHGFDGEKWDDFCFTFSTQLLEVFSKFRSESRFSVDYLPNEIKQAFWDYGFRNIFIIRSKDRLVGCLLVGEKRSEAPFHRDDLEFLSTISKQASVAIENAFLYEELAGQERLKHELEIARRIQLASLPQTTPMLDGLEIDGLSIPAHEVGGDYFDYLNGVTDGVTIIVGDVSGKGTSAALYMSKVQGILRSLNNFNLSPRELFIHANKLLFGDIERKSFVTALGGFFLASKRRLVLARAGHLPLYYFNARNATVEEVTPRGLGLGLNSADLFSSHLEEKTIRYNSGDVFLFLTDGATEAQNAGGDEFGEDRVRDLLLDAAPLPAAQIRAQIVEKIQSFSDAGVQHDDLTIVVVKAL